MKVEKVALNGIPLGRLALRPDRLCAFEYDSQWLEKGVSISPVNIPIQPGLFNAKRDPFNGLFGVFSDSLPDGWGTLLIDRWLHGQGIEPASISVLDRLTLVGSNGMGALTYEPDHGIQHTKDHPDIDQLALNVQKVLTEEEDVNLEQLIRMGESSGGARPKVMIRMDGRRIHVHSAGGLLYASFRLSSLDYTALLKLSMVMTGDINETEKMFRLMVFNVLTGDRESIDGRYF